ncbi:hypothetical protein GEMRC1_005414 [Eukaryota sp. GEM-RC1]
MDPINIELLRSDPSFSSSARRKLNEYFVVWICLPNTQKLLSEIVQAVKEGKPLPARLPASPVVRSPKAHSSPPRSPTSTAFFKTESPPALSPLGSPIRKVHAPPEPFQPIPTTPPSKLPELIIPIPGRITSDSEKELVLLTSFFPSTQTLSSISQQWIELVRQLELPTFFSHYLAYRISTPSSQRPPFFDDVNFDPSDITINQQDFSNFWKSRLVERQPADKMFNTLAFTPDSGSLILDDLLPLLQFYVHTHSGLSFLKETPEFQGSYAETVALRIMYMADPTVTGFVSRLGWRKSKIADAMIDVDGLADVNLELSFFSYEHFYVLYCKFWELDINHNKLLDREALLKYGNFALSSRAIDRILQEAPRKLSSKVPETLSFHDFVPFCLSEEDKNTEPALIYWTRVCDLDGDGILSLLKWNSSTRNSYNELLTLDKNQSRLKISFARYSIL